MARASSSSNPPGERAERRGREGTEDLPRYLQLVRMESRLYPEQRTELLDLRWKLMAARTETGHRITENSLIRIAVDLLLQNKDLLEGDSEEELGESLLGSMGRLREVAEGGVTVDEGEGDKPASAAKTTQKTRSRQAK